ncbi:MAG: 4Fe-4S binding protein [Fusobacteriaceae bacterium]|jgi:polyferredoxin|nr:4Fe-4S binding protein [Fusobacteriaceae bacterium]
MRTFLQAIFFALTNLNAVGFVRGTIYRGKLKAICLPGLNCYSCPGSLGSCPIGAIQSVLTTGNYRFPFYAAGFLLLYGSLFGRLVCGWLCPFGFVQDLIYRIPSVKKRNRFPGDRILRRGKILALVVFVIALPLFVLNIAGLGTPWFCKYLCPGGALFAGLPLVAANRGLSDVIGALFFLKLGILLIFLFAAVVVFRPFCKYLCPLGLLYGFFNNVSLFRYKIDRQKCNGCGACEKTCGMGVPVLEDIDSPECIRCGLCGKKCPQGAIYASWKK